MHHWLRKESPHSVHAPALYRLYTEVIQKDSITHPFIEIEASRKRLLADEHSIPFQNLGSGHSAGSGSSKVKDIASKSLTPEKWCRLLIRLSESIQAKNILELGTSLGISALYLSSNTERKVWTMEGNAAVATIAAQLFSANHRTNIELVSGNIDEELGPLLDRLPELDFIFLDANHRYEPTLRYAEQVLLKLRSGGLIIADDIHRSKEMNQAWNELRFNPEIQGSINLFRWGILVKGPSEINGHHIWDYA